MLVIGSGKTSQIPAPYYKQFSSKLQGISRIYRSFVLGCFDLARNLLYNTSIHIRRKRAAREKSSILARDIAFRIESEMNFPGQIKVNVIREKRAIEYAK